MKKIVKRTTTVEVWQEPGASRGPEGEDEDGLEEESLGEPDGEEEIEVEAPRRGRAERPRR